MSLSKTGSSQPPHGHPEGPNETNPSSARAIPSVLARTVRLRNTATNQTGHKTERSVTFTDRGIVGSERDEISLSLRRSTQKNLNTFPEIEAKHSNPLRPREPSSGSKSREIRRSGQAITSTRRLAVPRTQNKPSGTKGTMKATPSGHLKHKPVKHDEPNDKSREVSDTRGEDIENQTGTVRKKSYMRTVSKEDYLLGRGANPRTGIITPGVSSADSSLDEGEILKARGLYPSAKWRQRGDQWISLDVGEPTPMGSPPASILSSSQPLHAPPKLVVDKPSQFVPSSVGKISSVQSGRPSRPDNFSAHISDAKTPPWSPTDKALPSIPGSFPIAPQRDKRNSTITVQNTDQPIIRRKPVVYQDNKESADGERRKCHGGVPSCETVIRRPSLDQQARSFFAPAARNIDCFSPEDVGKSLPTHPRSSAVPYEEKTGELQMPGQQPFLGVRRGDWIEDVPASIFSTSFLPEKMSACPPTSNGPSQFHPSKESMAKDEVIPLRVTNTYSGEGRLPRPMGTRGGHSMPPFIQHQNLTAQPRFQTYNIDPRAERRVEMNDLNTSGYSKPPPRQQYYQTPKTSRVRGPRMMIQPRLTPEPYRGDGVYPPPHNIMSMSTSIPTHTFIPSGLGNKTASGQNYIRPEFHQIPASRDPLELHQTGQIRSCPQEVYDGPNQWGVPIFLPRPPMIPRLDGTYSIPRINQPKNHLTDMAAVTHADYQSETTALRNKGGITAPQNDVAQVRFRAVQLEAPTLMLGLATPNKSSTIETTGSTAFHYPPKSCAKNFKNCEKAYFVDSQPNIGGAIPMSDGRHAGDSGVLLGSGATSGKERNASSSVKAKENKFRPAVEREEEDQRDHSICCPDCCAMDCHEGCLGHPSPGSNRARSGIFRTMSDGLGTKIALPATSRSTVADSEPEVLVGGRILGFLRSSFRTPAKPERESGARGEPKRREISPKRPQRLSPTPVTTTAFRGGDSAGVSEGAKCAAKHAMGFGEGPEDISVARIRARCTTLPYGVDARQVRANESKGLSHQTARLTAPANEDASIRTTDTTRSQRKRRDVSGTSLFSLATNTIEIPGLNSLASFSTLLEILFVVPLDAARMWIQNHPEVQRTGWQLLDCALEMGRVVMDTVGWIWSLAYLYSKTGKLRVRRRDGTVAQLAWNVVRSVIFVLFFIALAVLVARVVRCLLGMLAWTVWVLALVGRGVGWVLL